MDGLISYTFKPEDLQCSFFRYVTRELLACAVMRPVLNLATPKYSHFFLCCVCTAISDGIVIFTLLVGAGLSMRELKMYLSI